MAEEETKICPKCGMEVSADMEFCPFCGGEIPQMQKEENKKEDICDVVKYPIFQDTISESKTKEENAEQNTSGTKICPQCGNECKSDDFFCNKCGCDLKKEKKCPNCGISYKDGDTFCGECGRKLSNADVTKNISQSQTTNYNASASAIKCKYCGSQISSGIKKCPHCGEWLEGGSGCGCGCSGLLVILCIIGAIFLSYIGESINLPFIGELTGGAIVIVTICYFFPSLIAEVRNSENSILVFLLTLFFGWSVIGWILALIFAFTGRRRH